MAINRAEHPITLDEMINVCRLVSVEIEMANARQGVVGDTHAEILWAAAYKLESLKDK